MGAFSFCALLTSFTFLQPVNASSRLMLTHKRTCESGISLVGPLEALGAQTSAKPIIGNYFGVTSSKGKRIPIYP